MMTNVLDYTRLGMTHRESLFVETDGAAIDSDFMCGGGYLHLLDDGPRRDDVRVGETAEMRRQRA
jgi:hypothetical protein